MRRILLTIGYDGTAYGGWQWQNNAPTIQASVEEAITKVTGESIRILGASRTDAGVHALGQRAHFDTNSAIPADRFAFALNAFLPDSIRIHQSEQVSDTFHARYDVIKKQYTYRFYLSKHAHPLCHHMQAHVPYPLDLPLIHNALPSIVGTHDFAAFQSAGSTAKTTVRTIISAELEQSGTLLTLTISGTGFLYNMVRIIAGSCLGIGSHRIPPNAFDIALASGIRRDLGITAPAKGLELTHITYPANAEFQ